MRTNRAVILSNFEQILKKLISFETLSDSSTNLVMDWIEEYLFSCGCKVLRFPVGYNTKIENLYATVSDKKVGGICFSGHIDVVPPQDKGWYTPPFELHKKDNKLYGRGTVDMKSFIALIMAMIPYWQSKNLKTPIHLALTCDEELGCKGVSYLTHQMNLNNLKPDFVIVGEPTECIPVSSHKGGIKCTTVIHGISGHSSTPASAVNAIYYAMDYVNYLRQIQDQAIKNSDLGCSFDPPYTTYSVGQIFGGTAVNIVPENCEFKWEVRVLPEQNPKVLIHDINSYMLDYFQNIDPRISFDTKINSSYPGLSAASNRNVVNFIQSLGSKVNPAVVSFGAEAGSYAQAGFSSILWGPGSIEEAHRPNEFIETSQIENYLNYLLNL
ncbi:acetylornithine deacetylase [Oceanispirochaeta crateris]|nr:acetylornithine deacetylase [Oceanispirochaeta crateris]